MSLDDLPANAPQRPTSQSEPVVRRVDRASPSVVKITRAEGDDTVVASGLQPGDQVVTVGQVRLAPGTKVSLAKPAKSS